MIWSLQREKSHVVWCPLSWLRDLSDPTVDRSLKYIDFWGSATHITSIGSNRSWMRLSRTSTSGWEPIVSITRIFELRTYRDADQAEKTMSDISELLDNWEVIIYLPMRHSNQDHLQQKQLPDSESQDRFDSEASRHHKHHTNMATCR